MKSVSLYRNFKGSLYSFLLLQSADCFAIGFTLQKQDNVNYQ